MRQMKLMKEEWLKELRRLIHDYSFPERRTVSLLMRIDELLDQAFRNYVIIGMKDTEVEEIIGAPYIRVGEEGDQSVAWLYPCLPEKGEGRSETDRFVQLSFIDGKLSSMEKRKWDFIKE